MNPIDFDLAGQVLDHTVVDAREVPCGKVDDVEIEGAAGQPLRVKAILMGPGAWGPRLPRFAAFIAAKLFGTHVSVVPWEQVEQITPTVKLRVPAEALGLDEKEHRASLLLRRLLL